MLQEAEINKNQEFQGKRISCEGPSRDPVGVLRYYRRGMTREKYIIRWLWQSDLVFASPQMTSF